MTILKTHRARTAMAASLIALLATSGFAQSSGSTEAMHQQGVMLVYSSNVMTDDTREGLAMLETAAEAGNVDAMISLGELLLYATVVPRDWPRARAV